MLFVTTTPHSISTTKAPGQQAALPSGASDAFPEWIDPTGRVQGCCVDLGDVRGVPLAQKPCLCTGDGLEVTGFGRAPRRWHGCIWRALENEAASVMAMGDGC